MQLHASAGEVCVFTVVQELRDAEVEQLQLAVLGHNDVGRFEIAVDDEAAVRVVDGVAGFLKQAQSCIEGQPMLIAVIGNRNALDELHRKVGPPVARYATVQEAGNVRVIEAGEDSAFLAEAAQHTFRVHALLDDLQCRPLLKVGDRSFGEEHRAHAADPNAFEDSPAVDLGADQRRVDVLHMVEDLRVATGRRVPRVRIEQSLEFGFELCVIAAGVNKKARTFALR